MTASPATRRTLKVGAAILVLLAILALLNALVPFGSMFGSRTGATAFVVNTTDRPVKVGYAQDAANTFHTPIGLTRTLEPGGATTLTFDPGDRISAWYEGAARTTLVSWTAPDDGNVRIRIEIDPDDPSRLVLNTTTE